MAKYVIFDEEDGMMMQEVHMHRRNKQTSYGTEWTIKPEQALHFEYEKAQATIQFINDVIDWELAQNLAVKSLKLC